ncbi:MAG: TlpA disulfide reductase family protein, partial [Steroidobacteraceae bacterium]
MRRDALKILMLACALLAPLPALPAAARHPLLGQPAIDFALRSVAGVNVRLSEYRGDVVLLSFWGSRCGQCLPQLAALDKLQTTYGSAGLVTLGVNVDDDQAAAREFAGARRVGFALLLDPAKSVARSYRVDALPLVILVDRAGVVREVLRDFRTGTEQDYLA